MNIKVKAVSDAEEEVDPVPITFPEIKAEPEGSSVCTVRQVTQMCIRPVFSLISISVCALETTPLCC
jgi:hypothetical protein